MRILGITRVLLLGCGWASLALGTLGMFVPVLPTAPFVLLAAACFMRSSERLHAWLVEHPRLGAHVADYLAGRGLRMRAKVLAVVTLWASVITSAVVFVPHLAADVALCAMAAVVTAYLLRLPTCDRPACESQAALGGK